MRHTEEIKEKRQAEIMEAQQQISFEINQERIGQTLKVIVDRQEGDFYIGRTEWDSAEVDNEVLITGAGLSLGDFVQVEVTDATEFDLMATVAK